MLCLKVTTFSSFCPLITMKSSLKRRKRPSRQGPEHNVTVWRDIEGYRGSNCGQAVRVTISVIEEATG